LQFFFQQLPPRRLFARLLPGEPAILPNPKEDESSIEPQQPNGKRKPSCHKKRDEEQGQHEDKRACRIESSSKPIGEQLPHHSAGLQRPPHDQLIWKEKSQDGAGPAHEEDNPQSYSIRIL